MVIRSAPLSLINSLKMFCKMVFALSDKGNHYYHELSPFLLMQVRGGYTKYH